MSVNFVYPYYAVDQSKILLIDSDSKIIMPQVLQSSLPISTISTTLPTAVIPSYTYTNPYIKVPLDPRLDLNRDPDVHETVINSIYRYLFNGWIYESKFKDLYKYISIVDGRATIKRDYSNNDSNIDIKIRFMKDNIISRMRIEKIIREFVQNTSTNWYDVEKNSMFIKDIIFKYMKKKLKTLKDKKEKHNKH